MCVWIYFAVKNMKLSLRMSDFTISKRLFHVNESDFYSLDTCFVAYYMIYGKTRTDQSAKFQYEMTYNTVFLVTVR